MKWLVILFLLFFSTLIFFQNFDNVDIRSLKKQEETKK